MRRTPLAFFGLMLLLSISLSPALAAPRRGGSVIIGLSGDPDTLNPLLAENGMEAEIFQALFSSLYRIDRDTDFTLDLLTKMPTRKGLVYSYELRKGVKFSDGHELDSQDVKFTWECLMNPKIPVPDRAGWDKIKSIDIPEVSYKGQDGKTYKTYDKYHFNVTLKNAYACYDLLWANTPILPKHILEKEIQENAAKNAEFLLDKSGRFSRSPVGSGPFLLKEWKAGSHIMAIRNPVYFRGPEQPYLDSIVWKIIPDPGVMLSELRAGTIDVYHDIPNNLQQEIYTIPGLQVFKNPGNTYNHIQLNLWDPNDLSRPHPILSDKRVRQALDYAFPRETIVQTILGNLGYPAYANIPPISWAFNKRVALPHFDPGKARQLLDEAGWAMGDDGFRYKDGRKLQLTLYTNAGNKSREAVSLVCQEYWRQIGVDLILRFIDFASLQNEIMANRRFDLLMVAWIAKEDPGFYWLWHSKQIPTAGNKEGQNYVGYMNPEMDKLIEDGLKAMDREALKELYGRMQEILAEDVPYIFINFYAKVDGVRYELRNYKANSSQATDTWNCYEWYWAR